MKMTSSGGRVMVTVCLSTTIMVSRPGDVPVGDHVQPVVAGGQERTEAGQVQAANAQSKVVGESRRNSFGNTTSRSDRSVSVVMVAPVVVTSDAHTPSLPARAWHGTSVKARRKSGEQLGVERRVPPQPYG
jgi:hypothetical protein